MDILNLNSPRDAGKPLWELGYLGPHFVGVGDGYIHDLYEERLGRVTDPHTSWCAFHAVYPDPLLLLPPLVAGRWGSVSLLDQMAVSDVTGEIVGYETPLPTPNAAWGVYTSTVSESVRRHHGVHPMAFKVGSDVYAGVWANVPIVTPLPPSVTYEFAVGVFSAYAPLPPMDTHDAWLFPRLPPGMHVGQVLGCGLYRLKGGGDIIHLVPTDTYNYDLYYHLLKDNLVPLIRSSDPQVGPYTLLHLSVPPSYAPFTGESPEYVPGIRRILDSVHAFGCALGAVTAGTFWCDPSSEHVMCIDLCGAAPMTAVSNDEHQFSDLTASLPPGNET